MANRIVGNLYILDSSEGANTDLSWNTQRKVSTIAFWGADTTSELILTMGGSNNQIAHFSFPLHIAVNSGVTAFPSTQQVNFPSGVYFDALAVNTLTAGTGWIYFL